MSPTLTRCSVILQLNTKLQQEQEVINGVRSYAAIHQLPWDIVPIPNGANWSRMMLQDALPHGVFIGRSRPQSRGTAAADYPWVAWRADELALPSDVGTGDAAVCFDAQALGQVAVDYLCRSGVGALAVVRKVASLTRDDNKTRIARLQAFCAQAKAMGREVLELCPNHLDRASYFQRLRDLSATTIGPIGVFCHNDVAGEWLINDLLHAGVQVPRDYLVLGSEGSAAASAARMPLSSVRLPYQALGRAAAGLAHQLLSGTCADQPCVAIAPMMVDERDSTAAHKRSDDKIIKRALKRLAFKKPLPGVRELANYCGCSRQVLHEHFRRELRCSPQQWLEQCAMQRAARLLAESNLTLSAIAQQCGFAYGANLSTQFKKRFGLTPSAYRKQEAGPERPIPK